MRQFLLSTPPEPDPGGPVVRLTGKDYHYLVRVRRLENGALFPARLPNGEPVTVRVLSTTGGVLMGRLTPDRAAPENAPGVDVAPNKTLPDGVNGTLPESAPAALPPVILFQALPKGLKMDLIVRQATEAGLAEIVPFEGGHSVARLGEAGGTAKTARWERIIKEARQQSGSATDTRVRPPCTIDGLLAYWERLSARITRPLGLILHPGSVACVARPALPEDAPSGPLAQGGLHDYLDTTPDLVVIAVGPEGGFTPEELNRFATAGFKPLSLGNTVLRTETAALYAAAAVRVILLERPAWILKPSKQHPR
jgi:16S rRNA (uracil1498-N3)-methyltransferase